MKHIFLLAVAMLTIYISKAQPVTHGTTSFDELDFITNNIIRGRWLPEGPLLIKTTTPPASWPVSDPDYCAAIVDGDWVLQGGAGGGGTWGTSTTSGNFYLSYDRSMRGSPYDYGSIWHDNGDYAAFVLYDGTDLYGIGGSYPGGYMFLDGLTNSSYQRNIAMQVNRGNGGNGKVLIGDWQHNSYDRVQVTGSHKAKGYLAAIQTVTDGHTAANDEYTILVNAPSMATYGLTLPMTGIDAGKIFVVKNIGAGNVSVNAAGGSSIDGASAFALASWSSLMVQWDGTSRWSILGSH